MNSIFFEINGYQFMVGQFIVHSYHNNLNFIPIAIRDCNSLIIKLSNVRQVAKLMIISASTKLNNALQFTEYELVIALELNITILQYLPTTNRVCL